MQYLDVARTSSCPDVKEAIKAGISNGCPFCKGRTIDRPNPGTKIKILSGRYSGWNGVVLPVEQWWSGSSFSIKFEDDRRESPHLVYSDSEQFTAEPFNLPPQWLPPLSIDDLAFLDEAIVRMITALRKQDKWSWRDVEFQVLITMCWHRRLPIDGDQVWEVCNAHGMPKRFRRRFVEMFNFGIGLLVISHGRPPIKRRRVEAMSIGRYEPDRRTLRKRSNERRNRTP